MSVADLAEMATVLAERAALLEGICAVLQREAEALDFPGGCPIRVQRDAATYRVARDPVTGSRSLVGEWRDAANARVGSVVIHAEGSCFAEYDVVREHPADRRWFVEAVTAWGREGGLKGEPRLLPALA